MSDFTFHTWCRYLEFDADQVGMRQTVKRMSDTTLYSFWLAGIQPTTRAVIRYCESASSPSEERPPNKPPQRLRSRYREDMRTRWDVLTLLTGP